MFSDRLFQITILISLITHGIIIFQNPNLIIFSKNKKGQNLEVSYLKNLEKPKEESKDITSKKEPFLKLPSRVNVAKRIPPPSLDKENIFKPNREISLQKTAFTKPTFVKPDVISVKKKITLPPIDIDKINNPTYISYYQIVREKIKRAAYRNYTRTDVGEIYLSFLISSDGYLNGVNLREEKSSPNPYLKEIALRSIKDASPFPNFPKELGYPELSFNVVISFEIE